MFRFKAKGDANDNNTYIIVPPHQLIQGKAKVMSENRSK